MAIDTARLDAIIDKYMPVFIAGDLHCGEASLTILNEYFGTCSDVAPRIASCFGGGMSGTRHTCGLVTGALMAIGLKYGREIGGDRAPSADRGRKLIEWYIQQSGTLECRPLVDFDDAGSIGKRYRRQDEIGTPICITYDFDSLEDNCVTVRNRDTMEQKRISIEELKAYIANTVKF